MRHRSTPSMGAFHPAIFLLLVYAISLTMSIFVCRIIFFSINKDDLGGKPEMTLHQNATALR